ncbi:MAG: hypothetical protein HQL73_08555, partial [Magnetococcales bacterium]|nr:hypothetical protein [Magnetococcales bacterium]
QAIAGILESQIKKIMLSKVRGDYVFTVIDPAVVPPENNTVNSKSKIIVMIGSLGGFVAGMILAFISDLIVKQRKRKGKVEDQVKNEPVLI